MWMRIVRLVIKYRLPLIIAVGLITVFMGYHASQARIAHSFISTLPANDPEEQYLAEFRKQFGEDGNIIAIGLKDSALFSLQNFRHFQSLCEDLKNLSSIKSVVSLPQMQKMEKDTAKKQFVLRNIFPAQIESQMQLDSLLQEAQKHKFYAEQIINLDNGAVAILASMDDVALNSAIRMDITNQIIAIGNNFSARSGTTLHYAGLPLIRSVITSQLSRELKMFLILSVVITGLMIFLFFRSFRVVMLAMTVIGVAVIWSVGTVALFGFKLTLLSGMLPPIMVVIGVPNTIYVINKYHLGYMLHGNKMLALGRVVQRVGMATFLTNLTTAIGFLVLLSTKISILREFGVVAGLNVMALFVISLILVPGLLSWMRPPSPSHISHLNIKIFDQALLYVNTLVHKQRARIYIIIALIVFIAVIGVSQLNTLSYMADDMPKGSKLKKDLAFFEQNFSGVMPLEVVVNTGKRRGVLQIKNLKKIEQLENFMESQQDISKPVSLIGFIKAAKQAFYNNNPNRYELPNKREQVFILRYIKDQITTSNLFKAFVDTSLQTMRISYHMVDIGSHKMDSLVNQIIRPKIKAIFEGTPITVNVTGTTPVFVQGNKFLISSLQYSLLLAFGLISITIGTLFANFRMVIVSLIPNLIPMLITAALMGYMDIALKPSTVLIFSIIFGISIDFSIHFLAKYRQELYLQNGSVSKAISATILEVGKSMIYTSIVLFSGFIIFTFSAFGGTTALGLLTSTTLAMSAVTNLIILPSLIITFNYKAYNNSFNETHLHKAKTIAS